VAPGFRRPSVHGTAGRDVRVALARGLRRPERRSAESVGAAVRESIQPVAAASSVRPRGHELHIEHDLPVAVIRTCRDLNTSPQATGVHEDFEAVNALLAACEAKIRLSFLTEAAQAADDHIEPVVHLISSWNIDKARDVAWVHVEILWAMRHVESLADRYQTSLARTVGMSSRCRLTPALPA
jgi:hypothetical protein